jgi:Uncharacterized membrane protein (homolog of Drosophila rhomboid)
MLNWIVSMCIILLLLTIGQCHALYSSTTPTVVISSLHRSSSTLTRTRNDDCIHGTFTSTRMRRIPATSGSHLAFGLPNSGHRRQEATKLYKKWGPRWNPRPNSDYYKRDDGSDDILGGKIDASSSSLRRRRRSKYVATFQNDGKFVVSLQKMLVVLNIALFSYQIFSAISYLPVLNSALRKTNYPHGYLEPFDILEQYILGIPPVMIESKSASFPFLQQSGVGVLRNRAYGQALIVATSLGPFTMDFVHQRLLTRLQPHRYLTSGFIHASLVHLFFNVYYLWKLPRWVEDNGGSGNSLGGWLLYLFTYLNKHCHGKCSEGLCVIDIDWIGCV